jgi:hypothetical protein
MVAAVAEERDLKGADEALLTLLARTDDESQDAVSGMSVAAEVETIHPKKALS